MLISTRGRYALRVLIDLAEHADSGYVPMKDIAVRQCISLKYLERIVSVLSKNGIIEGVHGKGGGYKLTRKLHDYPVGEILRLTEGDLAPVSCLECNASACERSSDCRTRPMWNELNRIVNDFFDGITIADLVKKDNI